MLIDSLAYQLERTDAVQGFWGKLDQGQDAALGVASSARPLMVAAQFARRPQPTLVVVAGQETAVSFARSLAAYLGESKVLLFPERSDMPFSPKVPDAAQVSKRLQAAWALQSGQECVVVSSARAMTRCLAPMDSRAAQPVELVAGQELADMGGVCGDDLDGLLHALEERGYQNTGELDGPGTFAMHGGTVDVFPGNLTYPVRLDFFGDELDEIRRIVPSTGQTIGMLEQVQVFPVIEFLGTKKALARARKELKAPALSNPVLRDLLEKLDGGLRFEGADALLPYLYEDTVTLGAYAGKGTLSVLVEPRSLFDDAQRAYDEASSRSAGTSIPVEGLFAAPAELDFGGGQRATYVSIMRVGGAVDDDLPVKRVDVAGNTEKLFGKLRSLLEAQHMVVFSAPNFRARENMKLLFVDHSLPINDLEEADLSPTRSGKSKRESTTPGAEKRRLRRGVVNVTATDVPLGMIFPKAKLALVSISDTQGARTASRSRRPVDITETTFPYKPGDYVVHAAHGVAFFKELVRREVDGVARDYLLLEYADDDKLYVPVEQLDRVTRYVGPEGASPRLTRLNTSDWSRALGKARKATKKLAFDLVDVYSRRAATQGFAFGPDTVWQREMEEAFPYQETADQLAAIADVKADMQAPKPMDRLICGDVGFGKTEVALRAAFKATQDEKQVMVLCPTTILAQQHYTNFKERFEPFGVTVEVLSRFRTPAQQAHALAGFQDGSVQVLVGTHRLLSRDVNPHDLGLVIIDEEQRFGVGHKEQMKNLRESIDVLTLSATPIPRTMQMSLSGVRDMSLIMTPPDERRPVEVTVGEWDPDVVSAAIRRELDRKGQVYYVSNRVRSIDSAVSRVTAAAEEARVGVAHGQMSKEELEKVMEDFSAGELDVLVATTIIESGIDNPHTNTLIIEDSQRLGLAQMYQLKGRVGRSSTQAYAYFMFPEHVNLTEEAAARLTALNEHQDLGSGMRIAMRDLEIRGAGSMLGAEQSGNMSAVGFDLFAQMLQQAVTATREGDEGAADQLPPALSDITVNLPGHTYLPEEYVPDADERVLWYRRIASAGTMEAVDALEQDLLAKRPEMPPAARNLLAKSRVKAYCNEHGVKLVSVVAGKLVVEPVTVPRDKMIAIRRAGGRYLEDKRKLTLPVSRYFKLEEGDSLFGPVTDLLKSLVEGQGDAVTSASGDEKAPTRKAGAAKAGSKAAEAAARAKRADAALERRRNRNLTTRTVRATRRGGSR
ncbi:MAG: transcription-repair coupling factor [Coriobacteriia bacterium]|nr:transcription-repair coupling factor [Coriobacteriia bacterium]